MSRAALVHSLAAAYTAAQRRLCSCLRPGEDEDAQVRFTIRTQPEKGAATVSALVEGDAPGLAECLDGIDATYAPFVVGSDCVGCGYDDAPTTITYPLVVDLRRR